MMKQQKRCETDADQDHPPIQVVDHQFGQILQRYHATKRNLRQSQNVQQWDDEFTRYRLNRAHHDAEGALVQFFENIDACGT
ncbi:hypothetical protein ACJ5NV_05980 [Loktanella agnita]|uniref:hypothetical protein n=1 Tax=Loktanella agnita TaxID=287097 RepID=UPI003985E1B9